MNNGLLWKPLDEANKRDPYAMYAELRHRHPVLRSQTGEYIVTLYEDVKDILKSPAFRTGNRLDWLKRGIRYFENKEEDLRAIHEAMNMFILMLNPPQHARIRNFVMKSWENRMVDEIIKANIGKLLKEIEGKESIDLVKAYSQPLPVLTICNILGIPERDYQHLTELGIAMNKTLDLYNSVKDLVMMNEAAKEFVSFFREQIGIKSQDPDEGLLSKMIIKNKQENHGLSEQELISIAIFLFVAGEETVAGVISNAFLYLLKYPEQLALLRKQPELMESVVEEVLRYDAVVQILGRISNEDYTVQNVVIPANATVTLVIGSANRDENFFTNADDFNITRKPNRHLSFGSGNHFCLGDWLGRTETFIAVKLFLEKYSNISLPEQELEWNKNLAIRRVKKLMINLA